MLQCKLFAGFLGGEKSQVLRLSTELLSVVTAEASFFIVLQRKRKKSSGKGFFHFSGSVSLPFEAHSLQPAEDSMDLLALLDTGCTAACF